MTSTSHPDATAFTARFLANPADRLGRLVFADWLEEQGGGANTAWAQYLRFMAQDEENGDGGCRHLAESVNRIVRARLTLHRVPGTSVLERLSTFLPVHRIWLRIGERRIPPAVLDYCQESFARLYHFMPVGATNSQLFIVVPDEEHAAFNSVHADVENFLSCQVTAFRGFSDDISQAIEAHHGRARLWSTEAPRMTSETESW